MSAFAWKNCQHFPSTIFTLFLSALQLGALIRLELWADWKHPSIDKLCLPLCHETKFGYGPLLIWKHFCIKSLTVMDVPQFHLQLLWNRFWGGFEKCEFRSPDREVLLCSKYTSFKTCRADHTTLQLMSRDHVLSGQWKLREVKLQPITSHISCCGCLWLSAVFWS